MKDKEHHLIVTLGPAEQIALLIRDELFDGSWAKMLKYIREKGSPQQKKDIPMINNLIDYEERYGVNLSDEEWEYEA